MAILSAVMRVALLLLLTAGLVSGCGQRGALYLRDNPPPDARPPKAAAGKAVPSPQQGSDDTEKKP
jgi:predicted small lipoprotein YifL